MITHIPALEPIGVSMLAVPPITAVSNVIYIHPTTGIMHPAKVVVVNPDGTYDLDVDFATTYLPPPILPPVRNTLVTAVPATRLYTAVVAPLPIVP
jgi:hypothetical protein